VIQRKKSMTINWLKEGGVYAPGLNLWRKEDPRSAGFIVRLGRGILRVRWSKMRNRFFISAYMEPKVPTEAPQREYIYVPGYTEFISEKAQKRFGYGKHKRNDGHDHPWGGIGEY
jgi:hypothetical protein